MLTEGTNTVDSKFLSVLTGIDPPIKVSVGVTLYSLAPGMSTVREDQFFNAF